MNADFIFPPDDSPRRKYVRPKASGSTTIAGGIFVAGIVGVGIAAAMAFFLVAKIGLYLFGVSLDGLQKRRES